MNTEKKSVNPVFAFYQLLLRLTEFRPTGQGIEEFLDVIIDYYEQGKGSITLEDVSREHLKSLVDCLNISDESHNTVEEERRLSSADVWWTNGFNDLEHITECAFFDLHGQIKNPEVRHLIKSWQDAAGIPSDLFTFVRKKKEFGNGMAAVTVIVSDVELFDKLLQNPDDVTFAGTLHYTGEKA